jgi:hypothetical protein
MKKKKVVIKKKKPSKGKTGGKAGNRNALKHGLYSEKFVEENALTIEKRKAIIDACIVKMFERFNGLDDIDKMSKCLNSIALAVTAANNCERTLAIVSGNYTPIEEIYDALKYLDPEED